jgi:hypothetical protein
MAKKVHSDVKAAVSLIIRENLSALKDVFTNHGHSESKPLSEKSEAQPKRTPQDNVKNG